MNNGPSFLVIEGNHRYSNILWDFLENTLFYIYLPFNIFLGSKLSIRRYTKLLLRRIKWTEYPLEDEIDASQNTCKQLWVGNVKKRTFPHWTVNYVDCDEQIEDILKPHKALHYFEMVKKYRDPLEDIWTLMYYYGYYVLNVTLF